MPNLNEITIIEGLRTGGTERERYENLLWKLFSHLIDRGIARHKLTRDEVRQAYNDAILCVIINIVNCRYKEENDILLKTYVETIFNRKCIDHFHSNDKNATTHNPMNEQAVKGILLEILPGDVKDVVEKMIEREDHLKMEKCLEKLKGPCKEILQLFASGYKDKEIAEMLKYSSAEVAKQSRYRCMEKLSQVLFKSM
jgi:RNA polymerase sigma factor (sigma-70 family)